MLHLRVSPAMLTALGPVVFALTFASDPPVSAPASPRPTQVTTKQSNRPLESSLGLTLGGGLTGGIGIGVRRHLDSRWGFHATGIPVLGDRRKFVALGIQGMYTFYRGRVARMYSLFGVQGIYNSEKEYRPAGTSGPKYLTQVFHTSFGPGVGVEIHFNDRISWALELPVTIMISSDLRDVPGAHLESGIKFRPIPSSALTLYY